MLEEIINWDSIKEMDECEDIICNMFSNSELLANYKTENELGALYKLCDESVVFISSKIKDFDDDDIYKIIEDAIIHTTLNNMMNYLRSVRFDQAINYDAKDLAEPLLSELYKNRKIDKKNINGK